MARRGGGFFRGDPRRDYILLSDGGVEDSEEAQEKPSARRLFALAAEQKWGIILGTCILLIGSLAQVRQPPQPLRHCPPPPAEDGPLAPPTAEPLRPTCPAV